MAEGKRRLILFDSNLFIWGFKPVSPETPKREAEQIRKVRGLLAQCAKEKSIIHLSVISVSEVLQGIPEEAHVEVLKVMSENFIVLPLDQPAAAISAVLARRLRKMDIQAGDDKNKLRNDLYILAIGEQNHCTDFYTDDGTLRNQAERLGVSMQVHPLPDAPPEQLDLPYDDIANSRQG